MNNIHLYIYGSKVFLNIINELNLNYYTSLENNVNFDKKNESNSTVRIVFPEKLKLLRIWDGAMILKVTIIIDW